MSRYSSKNSSLLKDNSWIKKQDDEDEDIDRDPNYGKSVLSHRSSDVPTSPVTKDPTSPTKTTRTSAYVQALSKRFSTNQDEPDNSTLPSGRNSSYTKSSTTTRTSSGDPSTTTTTVTKDGTTETTITTTTTKNLRSPVISSPTQTFTERVMSSSKDAQYSSYSPTKTTKVTETTITNTKDAEDKLFEMLVPSPVKDDSSLSDSKTVTTTTETVTVRSGADKYAEDKLYDTLIPSSIKDDYSPTDSKTSLYSTKSVTVRSSTNGDDFKTTTTTRTSSSAPEDELYSSLIPDAIKSPVSIRQREIITTVDSSTGLQSPTSTSSPSSSRKTVSYSSYPDDVSTTRTTSYTISSMPSDTYSSEHTSYSYSRPQSSYEYSGISSPTTYSSSLYRSRSEELLSDPVYSKSSYKTSSVLEKDLCTYCHKSFTGDAKMVLDDMKINCHASCFKCQICNNTLGHMRAGDSIWIYKYKVYCEDCFGITKEKWRR